MANDATPNQLWINRRNGTFEDRGLLSGTAVNAAGNPEGSMGIASDDYDNDGDEDLFVTNLIGESHALYVNDGRGNFEDARGPSGLVAAVAAYTGFGTKWFDYDLDGKLDLFIANGAVNIVEALRGQPFPFHQIDQLFRQGDGGKFVEMTAAAGPAFKLSEVGRGAAFGDVDNDGDVDVLVTNNNGPVRLLLNDARRRQSGGSRRSLADDPPRSARQPLGLRRARRRRAARTADAVAARGHRRKLSVGERRARPLRARARAGRARRCGDRRMAGRSARAMDGRPGRSRDHVEARQVPRPAAGRGQGEGSGFRAL